MSVVVVDESGAVEVVLSSPPPGTVVVVDVSLPGSEVVVGAGEPEPGIVMDVVPWGLEMVVVVLAVVVVVVGWVVVVVGTVVVVVGGRVVVVVVVDSAYVPRISTVSTNTSLLRRRPEKRKRTRKFSELKSLTSMLAFSLMPDDS
jgi:hypothetical protein